MFIYVCGIVQHNYVNDTQINRKILTLDALICFNFIKVSHFYRKLSTFFLVHQIIGDVHVYTSYNDRHIETHQKLTLEYILSIYIIYLVIL